MKTQIFHHAKIKFSSKKSSKRNQKNPSRYCYNSIITNLKVSTQAKISSFKNPHIKIDLLPRAKTPSATILYDESKHNILAYQGKANISQPWIYSWKKNFYQFFNAHNHLQEVWFENKGPCHARAKCRTSLNSQLSLILGLYTTLGFSSRDRLKSNALEKQ